MGQHFTPEPVAWFLWEQIIATLPDNPGELQVIDPAAGEGALLRAAAAHDDRHQRHGKEIDPLVAERGRDAGVEHGDGLFDLSGALCDVVVANPPFGRASDLLDADQWERLLDGEQRHEIWGSGGRNPRRQLASRPLEQLFVERCLSLVTVGGRLGLVLPDGLLANRRAQPARDWILQRTRPLLIAAMPGSTFRHPGLNAMAHVVVLERLAEPDESGAGPMEARSPWDCLIVQRFGARRARLSEALSRISGELDQVRKGGKVTGIVRVGGSEFEGRRWDASFWHGRHSTSLWSAQTRVAPLGDYIEQITYGPIVTGSAPIHDVEGITSIRQGDFTVTGLDLSEALRVTPNGPHDPARSRVLPGDLLMPRSGAGALGRNRVAVYLGLEEANIGCFVDRIRLRGINPFYVWLFLRSRPGWGQIQAAINGVGTPNINFEEIRSLQIPIVSDTEQDRCEAGYRERVLPLHEVSADQQERRRADAAFLGLVNELEALLARPEG
ncbi:MAG: N-6 DNA methylase [Gemmatimonadetes bacterium]|jgi:hypothetical protein|nr:N-6 DNA methylase [Gemmatimonadota bacterium]MBT7859644.1 N-6 DNA methylase [Gemmatimonadota bacterium]